MSYLWVFTVLFITLLFCFLIFANSRAVASEGTVNYGQQAKSQGFSWCNQIFSKTNIVLAQERGMNGQTLLCNITYYDYILVLNQSKCTVTSPGWANQKREINLQSRWRMYSSSLYFPWKEAVCGQCWRFQVTKVKFPCPFFTRKWEKSDNMITILLFQFQSHFMSKWWTCSNVNWLHPRNREAETPTTGEFILAKHFQFCSLFTFTITILSVSLLLSSA